MGKRESVVFVCSSCGSTRGKWAGRCPDCGEWNSFVEEVRARPRQGRQKALSAGPRPLGEVSGVGEARRSTGLSEFDRALGGGVVAGQVILVGGDPGVGKSTLLLQTCASQSLGGERVLYVSGEESPLQIKIRWDRLGLQGVHVDVLAETDAVAVAEAVRGYGAGAAVVDSVQVLHHPDLEGAPGVGQRPPHVLIAMGVNARAQEGHEGINHDQLGVDGLGGLLDPFEIPRD